jgi:hypothetical protein
MDEEKRRSGVKTQTSKDGTAIGPEPEESLVGSDGGDEIEAG